jgi:hypothetical protein
MKELSTSGQQQLLLIFLVYLDVTVQNCHGSIIGHELQAPAAPTNDREIPVMHYGQPVMIDCSAVTSLNATMTFKHWLLPDLRVVDAGTVAAAVADSDDIVLIGNYSLYISKVYARHLGIYLCYAEGSYDGPGAASVLPLQSRRRRYSRTNVYLYTPTVWEAYYFNFVCALSAAAACLVVTSGFCIVTSLRWFRPHGGATVFVVSGDGHAMPLPPEREVVDVAQKRQPETLEGAVEERPIDDCGQRRKREQLMMTEVAITGCSINNGQNGNDTQTSV